MDIPTKPAGNETAAVLVLGVLSDTDGHEPMPASITVAGALCLLLKPRTSGRVPGGTGSGNGNRDCQPRRTEREEGSPELGAAQTSTIFSEAPREPRREPHALPLGLPFSDIDEREDNGDTGDTGDDGPLAPLALLEKIAVEQSPSDRRQCGNEDRDDNGEVGEGISPSNRRRCGNEDRDDNGDVGEGTSPTMSASNTNSSALRLSMCQSALSLPTPAC